MYQLDVLRHGETELSHTLRGSTNDALTLEGWQQMQSTINSVLSRQTMPWDVVFSSPLQRCEHFAQKLIEHHGLPLYRLKGLEEMHFGAWEGTTTAALYAQFPEQLAQFWQAPSHFTPPDAEPMAGFAQRVHSALQQIQQCMQQHAYQRALVVCHAGVIKLMKCWMLQQPIDDLLKMSAELGQLNTFYLSEMATLHQTESR